MSLTAFKLILSLFTNFTTTLLLRRYFDFFTGTGGSAIAFGIDTTSQVTEDNEPAAPARPSSTAPAAPRLDRAGAPDARGERHGTEPGRPKHGPGRPKG